MTVLRYLKELKRETLVNSMLRAKMPSLKEKLAEKAKSEVVKKKVEKKVKKSK